jgi:hypothetical protein
MPMRASKRGVAVSQLFVWVSKKGLYRISVLDGVVRGADAPLFHFFSPSPFRRGGRG